MDGTGSRRRRLLVWTGALLGLLVVAFLAALAVDHSLRDEVQTLTWPHHFTAEAWRDHPQQRYHMAVDLAASGLLAGKSRRWLRDTLGPPEDVGGMNGQGVLAWPVPSPQRPNEYLVVAMRDGVALRWGVTSDPLTIVG